LIGDQKELVKIDYDSDKQEVLRLFTRNESSEGLFAHEGNYKFTNNAQQDELLLELDNKSALVSRVKGSLIMHRKR